MLFRSLFQLSRGTVRRLQPNHFQGSARLTPVAFCYSESSLVQKPEIEQSLVEEREFLDTEENRRIYNKNVILDLCVMQFDDGLLHFPQVLGRDEWDFIIDKGARLEEVLKVMPYEDFKKTGKIDNDTRQKLAKLGVYGMRIPEEYGGKALTETQCQYIHEILGMRPSLARFLAENEELGIKILVNYGTEAQKAKYLPKLATGEMVLGFAFQEESTSVLNPQSCLGLEAVQEGDKFTLKGEKKWVTNAATADAFIVLGTQNLIGDDGLFKVSTLFIVDKDPETMVIHPPMKKNWFKGVEISNVVFDNVIVGIDGIVGQYGKGYEIFVDIFKKNKVSVLAECSSIIKKMVFDMSEKSDNLKCYNKEINFNFRDHGIREMAAHSYGAESIFNYLASRRDYFTDPDLFIEIALAKIYVTEQLPKLMETYFSFMGRFSYEKNSLTQEYVQNSPYYSMIDDSIYDLKIYIMSLASGYTVRRNQVKFKQLTDPKSYPYQIVKYVFNSRNPGECDTQRLKLKLRQFVPDQVAKMADELEYCLYRLSYCTEKHILRHKTHTMEHDYELLILCEILAHVYALIAVTARVSKACQFNVKNCHFDLAQGMNFTYYTTSRVKMLSSLIGHNQESMECVAKLGRVSFLNKRYMVDHPLMRNF